MSEVFKAHSQKYSSEFVFYLALQLVNCGSRRGSSQDIPIKWQSFPQSCKMYKFTVLKSDPITNNALQAFLKILETLTGNIGNGVSFQDSYGWCRLKSSNYLLENLNFSRNFQSSSFSQNRRKIFLEVCRFYIVILLLWWLDFITEFSLANFFTRKLFQRTFRGD